jgi:hypothetical protein
MNGSTKLELMNANIGGEVFMSRYIFLDVQADFVIEEAILGGIQETLLVLVRAGREIERYP